MAEIAGGGKGVRPSRAGTVEGYTASAEPTTPDYEIEAVLKVHSLDEGPQAGVLGRFDPKVLTGYEAIYDGIDECWRLTAWLVADSEPLGQADERLRPGNYTMLFRLRGESLEVLLDGASKIAVEDPHIRKAGKVGVMLYQERDVGDKPGIYIDSINARDI
jgi:hypothetical protein